MGGDSGAGRTVAFSSATAPDDWRRYYAAARRHLLPNVGLASAVYVVAGVSVGVSLGLLPTAGPVGLAVLAFVAASFAAAFAVNARFTTALRTGLAGPVAMSASSAGVTVAQGARSTTFVWAAVAGWSEDAVYFFVSVAPFVGWPLPKSGFARSDDVEWFRARLAAVRPPSGR